MLLTYLWTHKLQMASFSMVYGSIQPSSRSKLTRFAVRSLSQAIGDAKAVICATGYGGLVCLMCLNTPHDGQAELATSQAGAHGHMPLRDALMPPVFACTAVSRHLQGDPRVTMARPRSSACREELEQD